MGPCPLRPVCLQFPGLRCIAHKFGPTTFFTMRTCFGALIQDFSVFPGEREVLIPPQEIFLVVQFDQSKDQNRVTLSSSDHICSHFNCAYLGGESCMREAGLPEVPGCFSPQGLQGTHVINEDVEGQRVAGVVFLCDSGSAISEKAL